MSLLLDILVPWASLNVLVCCLAWLSARGLDRREAVRAAGRDDDRQSVRQSADGTLHLLPWQADVYEPSSAR
jgi:hypothetical protein